MVGSSQPQYRCIRGRFGLFSVIDTASGAPADVGATAILLTRKEARQLISDLQIAHDNRQPKLVVTWNEAAASKASCETRFRIRDRAASVERNLFQH